MSGVIGIYLKAKDKYTLYSERLCNLNLFNSNLFLNNQNCYKIDHHNLLCLYACNKSFEHDYNANEAVTIIIGEMHNSDKVLFDKSTEFINNDYTGFFSLIHYNHNDEVFYIVCDHVRSIPIYYLDFEDAFIFSTDVKSLGVIRNKALQMNWLLTLRNNNYSSSTNLHWDVKEMYPNTVLRIINYQISIRQWMNYEISENNFDDCINASFHDVNETNLYNNILLSGGIDSSLLAKKINVENAYTLYDDIFIEAEGHDSIKEFCLKNNLSLTNVEIPIINARTKDVYMDMLSYYESSYMNIEYWLKSSLFEAIRNGDGKAIISGHGSDELFGGYSCNSTSYSQYIKNYYHNIIMHELQDNGLYDSKVELLNIDYVKGINDKIDSDKRITELNFEILKSTYNGLYSDYRNATFWGLHCYAPYLDGKLIRFAYNFVDEILLYDKKIIRGYAAKYINNCVAYKAKTPFIYNKHYFKSYRYIHKLLTYKKRGGDSLFGCALSTPAFTNKILNMKYIKELLGYIEQSNKQDESIEIILKIINISLLDYFSNKKWVDSTKNGVFMATNQCNIYGI